VLFVLSLTHKRGNIFAIIRNDFIRLRKDGCTITVLLLNNAFIHRFCSTP